MWNSFINKVNNLFEDDEKTSSETTSSQSTTSDTRSNTTRSASTRTTMSSNLRISNRSTRRPILSSTSSNSEIQAIMNRNNARLRELERQDALAERRRLQSLNPYDENYDVNMLRNSSTNLSISNGVGIANGNRIPIDRTTTTSSSSNNNEQIMYSALSRNDVQFISNLSIPVTQRSNRIRTSGNTDMPGPFAMNANEFPPNLMVMLEQLGFESLMVVPSDSSRPILPREIKKKVGCLPYELEALPTYPFETKHRSAVDNIECMICLTEFVEEDMIRLLPCLHRYHKKCIDPWLLTDHTCCICKFSVKE